MKKIIFWISGVIILIVLLFLALPYLRPIDKLNPIYLVPDNAVIIIETDNPIETWKKISSNAAWVHLNNNENFSQFTEGVDKLNSRISRNQKLFNMLGSREVLMSFHKGENLSDFLFTVDLKKASGLNSLKNIIYNILEDSYEITKRDYNSQEITELFSNETHKTIYISFINNLMLLSYSFNLIEASIDQLDKPVIGRDLKYVEIRNRISGVGLLRIYFNYALFNDLFAGFINVDNDYINSLGKSLVYSGLTLDIGNEGLLELSGFSNTNDTLDSYFLNIFSSGKGKRNIKNIIPQRTAVYFGLGFDSFSDFYENFENSLKKDKDYYNDYILAKEKIEKRFKINLKNNVIDWIGNEVAFIQIQPAIQSIENEFAVILHANNIQQAKQDLEYILQQVKKNSPVKFKEVDYKEYTINYLSVPGLIKLITGKLFSEIEKPYFTIIEDYVILSNHPYTLKSIIDDYRDNKTLALWDDFINFNDRFNSYSNLFLYVQTPLLYNNLQKYAKGESLKVLANNKEYFTCFPHIGFLMLSDGNMVETAIMAKYKDLEINLPGQKQPEFQIVDTGLILEAIKDTLFLTKEIFLDDLDVKIFKHFYENGKLEIEAEIKNGLKHGAYKEYFETGELKMEGKYKADKKDGIWKQYNNDGKLLAKRRYKDDQQVN